MNRRSFLKKCCLAAIGVALGNTKGMVVSANDSQDALKDKKATGSSHNEYGINQEWESVKSTLDIQLADVYDQLAAQGKISHYPFYKNLLIDEALAELERINTSGINSLTSTPTIYLSRGGAFGYEQYGTTVTITCLKKSQFDTYCSPYVPALVASTIISAILGINLGPIWGTAYGVLFNLSTIFSAALYNSINSNGGNAKIISTELNGEYSSVILSWNTYPYITIPVGIYHFQEF